MSNQIKITQLTELELLCDRCDKPLEVVGEELHGGTKFECKVKPCSTCLGDEHMLGWEDGWGTGYNTAKKSEEAPNERVS